MARIRHIKPGFFTNEQLADCSAEARLCFAGLWVIADREGRLEDRPRKIKAELFPYDNWDADKLLRELESARLIIRYEAEGARFIQIISFVKHQKPHQREAPSLIPPPPGYAVPIDVSAVSDDPNDEGLEFEEEAEIPIEPGKGGAKPGKGSVEPRGDGSGVLGMGITTTPPPPRARGSDEHWAVTAYAEKFGNLPHLHGQTLIEATVTDPEVWRDVLELWVGNRHQEKNVGNLVDRYKREVKKKAKERSNENPSGSGGTGGRESASQRNATTRLRTEQRLRSK